MSDTLKQEFYEFKASRQEAALANVFKHPEYVEKQKKLIELMNSIDKKLALKIQDLEAEMAVIEHDHIYRQAVSDTLQLIRLVGIDSVSYNELKVMNNG